MQRTRVRHIPIKITDECMHHSTKAIECDLCSKGKNEIDTYVMNVWSYLTRQLNLGIIIHY